MVWRHCDQKLLSSVVSHGGALGKNTLTCSGFVPRNTIGFQPKINRIFSWIFRWEIMEEAGDIRETQRNQRLRSLKSDLRAVLISKKNGLTEKELIKDCRVRSLNFYASGWSLWRPLAVRSISWETSFLHGLHFQSKEKEIPYFNSSCI